MNRGFLAARSLIRVPTRGKALANWARPSIDEIGVPTESWAQVNAKNQTKFNLHLLIGLASITATLTYVFNTVNFNTTPYHLLKNKD